MGLICESFYFYNNGVYKTIENYSPEGWFTDLKRVEPSIKIFGTREQIDKALDEYIKITGLNLDEVYDYENEEMLKVYKEKYDKMNNNKALITTI
tara:strand:+ start:1230 stop:1514 length:285 start_codon:yes stop_codon:yes gene_type:complete